MANQLANDTEDVVSMDTAASAIVAAFRQLQERQNQLEERIRHLEDEQRHDGGGGE